MRAGIARTATIRTTGDLGAHYLAHQRAIYSDICGIMSMSGRNAAAGSIYLRVCAEIHNYKIDKQAGCQEAQQQIEYLRLSRSRLFQVFFQVFSKNIEHLIISNNRLT